MPGLTLHIIFSIGKTIRRIRIGILISLISIQLYSQDFDLLIKNGRVIDSKNGIDLIIDIAVVDGKVFKVANNIPAKNSKKTIDAKNLIVTPGLIDIHTHVFVGSHPGQFANGFSSVSPDDFSLKAGITTVVDAGTSGWRNFPEFRQNVIVNSITRVLAFLNISGNGMMGGPFEQDLTDMDAKLTSMVIKQYPDIIVGTKIGHYHGTDWAPFERALQAGINSNVPLLLECHLPELPLDELLEKMRPGDIFTHAFGQVNDRMSILNEEGRIKPYVLAAKKKGIHFDVGHGGGSFHFSQAIPALREGFTPDSFGTDLHRFSMNAGMKDMLNIMSKYLNMGMNLKDIIHRATWNSARAIKRDDLGHLSEGAVADITILKIENGNYGYVDAGGFKINGDKKLIAEMTIREGRIVWDLNGLGANNWK